MLALSSLALRGVSPTGRARRVIFGLVDRRPRPVLRRRPDHARDLGAVGGRGPGDRASRRSSRSCCRSPPPCWSACSSSSATARPASGRLFGPVMVVWFVDARRPGPAQHGAAPGGARGASTRLRRRPVRTRRLARRSWPWVPIVLAVTGAEALYADMGHFGPPADPARLDGLRPAGAAAQLFRPGCAHPARSRRRIEHPFYRLAPAWLLCAADRAGDLRHDHREPGGDLGRVLADPPGRPARLPAADDDQAHQRHRDRPDLHAARQLAADGRASWRWSWASAARATSPPPTASRSPAPWASTRSSPAWSRATLWRWPLGSSRAGVRPVLLMRLRLRRRQRAQDPGRRLAAAGDRRRHLARRSSSGARGRSVLLRSTATATPCRWRPSSRSSAAASQRVAGTAVFMTGNTEVVPTALLHNLQATTR